MEPITIGTFVLNREEDVSGISGVGIVAEGAVFSDGTVVLRWRGETPTTVIHSSIESVRKLHGHDGKTHVEWI